MRLFIAINLDASLRRAIVDATAPLREAASDLSWAAEDKLHLTLKFLGEQPDDVEARLRAATDAVAKTHRRFVMRLSGIGAFPNFPRARVIWLGIDDEPRLELLQHDVEVECERAGFAVEGRPYRPHLTLARVRERAADEDVMRKLAREAKRVAFNAEAPVTSIDLMRSVLHGAHGATYERVHSAVLKGANA